MVRYADIEVGRRFLTGALGFEERAVHRDAAGAVERVDLGVGLFGRVTIGPAAGTAPVGTARRRFTVGGHQVAALLERARAAGATIVSVVTDDIFGDCAFTAEDPEGNRWTITGVVALTG